MIGYTVLRYNTLYYTALYYTIAYDTGQKPRRQQLCRRLPEGSDLPNSDPRVAFHWPNSCRSEVET